MADLETLWGGLTLESAPGVFPLGTDSVLLADFVRLRPRARFCDLGAGSGALGLLLCARRDDCAVTGVEIQPEAVALCRRNIARNNLENRMTVLEGDLRQHRQLLPPGGFTDVVSNPPYFPNGSPAAPALQRAAASSQQSCTVEDLARAAAWCLQWGGRFSLVHRPELLADLCCALRSSGLEPKRLRLVRHRSGRSPSLILLEAVRGGKPGLCWEPDLLLETDDGTPSPEYLRIYRREGEC